jgi:hypothetical protein
MSPAEIPRANRGAHSVAAISDGGGHGLKGVLAIPIAFVWMLVVLLFGITIFALGFIAEFEAAPTIRAFFICLGGGLAVFAVSCTIQTALFSAATDRRIDRTREDILNSVQGLRESIITSDMNVRLFAQTKEAYDYLCHDIQHHALQAKSAQFVQHSSERASHLILALAKHCPACEIELFLQEPEISEKLCSLRKERITLRMAFFESELSERRFSGRFRLYLYRTPASVNACRIQRTDSTAVLVFSLYSYQSDVPLGGDGDLHKSRLIGGENPCIVIESKHSEFSHFNDWFEGILHSHHQQCPKPAHSMVNRRWT